MPEKPKLPSKETKKSAAKKAPERVTFGKKKSAAEPEKPAAPKSAVAESVTKEQKKKKPAAGPAKAEPKKLERVTFGKKAPQQEAPASAGVEDSDSEEAEKTEVRAPSLKELRARQAAARAAEGVSDEKAEEKPEAPAEDEDEGDDEEVVDAEGRTEDDPDFDPESVEDDDDDEDGDVEPTPAPAPKKLERVTFGAKKPPETPAATPEAMAPASAPAEVPAAASELVVLTEVKAAEVPKKEEELVMISPDDVIPVGEKTQGFFTRAQDWFTWAWNEAKKTTDKKDADAAAEEKERVAADEKAPASKESFKKRTLNSIKNYVKGEWLGQQISFKQRQEESTASSVAMRVGGIPVRMVMAMEGIAVVPTIIKYGLQKYLTDREQAQIQQDIATARQKELSDAELNTYKERYGKHITGELREEHKNALRMVAAIEDKVEKSKYIPEDRKAQLKERIYKVLEGHFSKKELLNSSVQDQIGKTVATFIEQKTKGTTVIKDAISTAALLSGAMGLRVVAYGAGALAERFQKKLSEAKRESEKVELSKVMHDTIVKGAFETIRNFNILRGKEHVIERVAKAAKSASMLWIGYQLTKTGYGEWNEGLLSKNINEMGAVGTSIREAFQKDAATGVSSVWQLFMKRQDELWGYHRRYGLTWKQEQAPAAAAGISAHEQQDVVLDDGKLTPEQIEELARTHGVRLDGAGAAVEAIAPEHIAFADKSLEALSSGAMSEDAMVALIEHGREVTPELHAQALELVHKAHEGDAASLRALKMYLEKSELPAVEAPAPAPIELTTEQKFDAQIAELVKKFPGAEKLSISYTALPEGGYRIDVLNPATQTEPLTFIANDQLPLRMQLKGAIFTELNPDAHVYDLADAKVSYEVGEYLNANHIALRNNMIDFPSKYDVDLHGVKDVSFVRTAGGVDVQLTDLDGERSIVHIEGDHVASFEELPPAPEPVAEVTHEHEFFVAPNANSIKFSYNAQGEVVGSIPHGEVSVDPERLVAVGTNDPSRYMQGLLAYQRARALTDATLARNVYNAMLRRVALQHDLYTSMESQGLADTEEAKFLVRDIAQQLGEANLRPDILNK